MKRRIRSGQYEFPKPEWTNVSQDCKNLIRGCLKTNPEERLTIDEVIEGKWVAQYNTVPATPLVTSEVLKEENDHWQEVTEGMSLALQEMRVDQVGVGHHTVSFQTIAFQEETITVKNPKFNTNSKLIQKRLAAKARETAPSPIKEQISQEDSSLG